MLTPHGNCSKLSLFNKERGNLVMENEEAVDAKVTEVSKHATLRWVERMNEITDANEAKRFLVNNQEKVTKDIIKSFENSTFVYRGQLNKKTPHSTSNYYLLNDLVFVEEKGVIITLFKVSFGLPYDDLNEEVQRALIVSLQRATQEQQNVKSKVGVTKKNLKADIAQVNAQLNLHRNQIDLLTKQKNELDQQVKLADDEIIMANNQVELLASKLLYSRDLYTEDTSK